MTKEEIKEIRTKGYRYNKKLDVPTFKLWNQTCFLTLYRYECDDSLALYICSLNDEISEPISINLSGYSPENIEGLRKNEIYLDHNLKSDDPLLHPVYDLLGAENCGNLLTQFVTFKRLRLHDGFEKYCLDRRQKND